MNIQLLTIGVVIGCCFLFGLLTVLLSYQRMLNKKQLRELSLLTNQLAEKTEEIKLLQEEKIEKRNFTDTLNNAAVTTKLQHTRLQLQGHKTPDTPDKYKYLANMVKTGMNVDDVVDILDISPAEADQLVTLARMSRANG